MSVGLGGSDAVRATYQIFCETEYYRQWLLFWLLPSHRIEAAFFKVELPAHEREFKKAADSLSVQERLGPSYFFIPLVLGPLNSLVWWEVPLGYIALG